MKKIRLISFITLFSFLSLASVCFSDDPSRDREFFIDSVIDELNHLPETEEGAIDFIDYIHILKDINGAYAAVSLRTFLNQKYGKDFDIFMRNLLEGFDGQPMFDLKKLLAHPQYGKKVEALVKKRNIPLKKAKEMKTLASDFKPGLIILEFSYGFACGNDESDLQQYIAEINHKKLPEKRGILTFVNDTYQERFDKMMNIITDVYPYLSVREKKREYSHTADSELPGLIVKVVIQWKLDFDGEMIRSDISQRVKEFEESDDKEWIKIRVFYKSQETTFKNEKSKENLVQTQNYGEPKKEENPLTAGEKEALILLQHAKTWEEQWVALDRLRHAKLINELKIELIKILTDSKDEEIVKRAAFLLMKDVSVFSSPEIIRSLLIPWIKKISVEEFKTFLKDVPVIDKNFVFWVKDHNEGLNSVIMEAFLAQKNISFRDVCEILAQEKNHFEETCYKIIQLSYYKLDRCDDVITCCCFAAHPCLVNELAYQENCNAGLKPLVLALGKLVTKENYSELLILKSSPHPMVRSFMAQQFGIHGASKDMVHIVSLLRDPHLKVVESAKQTIEKIRDKK